MNETDVEARLASVRVGVWLAAIASIGCIVYTIASWDQGNRELILAISAAGLLSAPLVTALPLERIVRSARREVFFVGWSLIYILFIGACAALDGGSESPLALLLVLPFLFAALTYPLRATVIVGVFGMAVAVGLAVGVGGGGFMYSGFGPFVLLCVAILASWDASTKTRRRRELVDAADALRKSEATAAKQADQQREVARFGQQALGGAGIAELRSEAVRLMTSVLNVEVAGVLELLPAKGELLIAAAVGLGDGVVGAASVPAGERSQAGYTLLIGAPVVVADIAEESRFEQSEITSKLGIKSGVTVPIKGKGPAYGVLGIQAKSLRDYSVEDISFMQAIANVLANAIDRNSAEERTRHEALHDPLTGLPNRNLFLDRLEHAQDQARRHNASIAVLFLDLDQFKMVNDSLGHAAGDELLAAVAPRLQQALRPGDTIARFGGDEFAVLAEDISSERDATRVAERISEALTRPFVLRRREHFASASIGIAIATGGEEPEALIRDADAALYRAKEHGRGGYEIFDEVMRSRVIDSMQTENDLRRALLRREFELHYQPIVAVGDGSIVMLEALLRWNHPERGVLGPAGFVPVAEESRLIVPIGRWVIDEACRRAAGWQALDPDGPPVGVAVNISAPQLADSELPHYVRAAIKRNGIDPASLSLELTESTLLEEGGMPEVGLSALEQLGVKLVLDDFGTGFSSLGYLKRLPLSGIKLDRAFVEHLTDGGDDAAIVKAVNEMATALGLDVCAEGIETAEQLQAVRELGCGQAQGFYLSEPVPAEQIGSAIRQRTGGAV